MENLRETERAEDFDLKRKRSLSPDESESKLKLVKSFYSRPVIKKPLPIPQRSPAETSESSESEDYSQWERITDLFNANKPNYARIDQPLIEIPTTTSMPEVALILPNDLLSLNSTPTTTKPSPEKKKNDANPTSKNPLQENPVKKSLVTPKENLIFSEKYAPHTVKDLTGNRPQCLKLHNWLSNWSTSSRNKAVLLSGPPGTGKTTSSRIACKLGNYTSIEFNASDCRNKQMIMEKIKPFICNTSMVGPRKIGKSVLIMDEVDGMSSGDQGGISALIECIKITKIPIICICNNRYCSSIKTLAKYCLDIKFIKPLYRDTCGMLRTIAGKEGIKINDERVFAGMVESANGDLRALLNMLEMSKNETFFEYRKDQTVSLSAFEAAGVLLDSQKSLNYSLTEKVSLVLTDFDLISGMITENYTEILNFSDLSDAADALALSDLIITKIRTDQEWTLLPDFAYLSLFPTSCSVVSGYWPQFPQAIAKNSTLMKNQRLLQEFKHGIWHSSAACDDISACEYRQLITEFILQCENDEEKKEIAGIYRIDKQVLKENIAPFVRKETGEELKKIGKKGLKWLKGPDGQDSRKEKGKKKQGKVESEDSVDEETAQDLEVN